MDTIGVRSLIKIVEIILQDTNSNNRVQCDMGMVEYAPHWLLHKLSTAGQEELILIVRVLWGV